MLALLVWSVILPKRETRGLVNGFAPRIFLRPSPAQAIPLEMLKRLEQEQARVEAAEAKGKRRGPFLSTPQRVTFNQFMFISCSIHALSILTTVCDTVFRTFNVGI